MMIRSTKVRIASDDKVAERIIMMRLEIAYELTKTPNIRVGRT